MQHGIRVSMMLFVKVSLAPSGWIMFVWTRGVRQTSLLFPRLLLSLLRGLRVVTFFPRISPNTSSTFFPASWTFRSRVPL